MTTKAKNVLYATVGAGDALLEKTVGLRKLATPSRHREAYEDAVARGRDLFGRIRTSAPSKRAMSQTKTARSQLKGAATSVAKAARANAEAGRSAVRKVTRAS